VKTTEEMIEVMQHFIDGGDIQCKPCWANSWRGDKNPVWDWFHNYYRIKPVSDK